MTEIQQHALKMLALGYVPVRLEPNSKAPKTTGWQFDMPTEDSVRRAFARPSNIGVRTGDLREDGTRLAALDVDIEDINLIRCVERSIGCSVPVKHGKKGCTYLFRINETLKTHKIQWVDGATQKKIAAIDVLCIGAQTVIPPSIHPDTKLPYRWIAGTPLDQLSYSELPVLTMSVIDEIKGYAKNAEDPIYKLNDMQWAGVGGGGDTHDTCVAAVASMVARKWPSEDIHERIQRAKQKACEEAGMPYNWPEAQKTIQGWIDSAKDKDFGSGQQTRQARQQSQGTYAEQFVRLYGAFYRFDVDADTWYHYDGKRWRSKSLLTLKHQIIQMLPDAYRNSGFVSGMEQLLRCWPELHASRRDWNPAKHLLNTPSGTYDLRTGLIEPHNPADMITCMTPVSPEQVAHPLWSEKLLQWFGVEAAEQAYIQSLAGLCLTGETKDALIPFWVGPGGDGKSVITSLWQHLLGDYARTSTESAFIETRQSQHTEELAWLSEGVRLVIVPEAGGVWAEARLKQVTGGERVAAAYKHKSVFEFEPQFTLLVTSNEPPRLRSAGKAMARRFHVYRFSKPIDAPDTQLPEKLRAEAGAILAWMIQGAVRYYSEGGLKPSPVVIESSAEYQLENDQVQQWLDECAIIREDGKWHAAKAFASYQDWAESAGIKYALDRPGLTRRLSAKGIPCKTKSVPGHSNSQRCYIGIGPNETDHIF